MKNIRPLLDNVIVKREEEQKTSAGGIVLPGSGSEKPNQGVVISVGPGAINKDGRVCAVNVQKGQKVIFGKYADSNSITIDGKELLIISEKDIYAVLED
jgi:chaperonin GroES